uniref:non-specific serine/threonine protein kinase n=1 Tax=Oryza punctata TaxID=4537 RepID=A0A0E0L0C4_ORYPU
MRSCRRSTISGVVRHLAWLVLVCSWQVAAAQAQQAPKTDPAEVEALNTILGRWGKKASSEWNMSGEPCSGYAVDKTDWDYYPNINPFIKCDCTFSNNTVCHITKLRVTKLDVVGPIPTELQNLTHLVDLALAMNPLSGPLPKELGNLTNLVSLGISLDNFTGGLPEELGNLTKLRQLRASDNGFIGKIPDYLGSMTNLQDIAFQGNSFEGPIPQSLSNLTKLTSLILRNCKISGDLRTIDFSKFENFVGMVLISDVIAHFLMLIEPPDKQMSMFDYVELCPIQVSWEQYPYRNVTRWYKLFLKGNEKLDRLIYYFLQGIWWQTTIYMVLSITDYSFAVDCGSNTALRGSDNTIYEADTTNLGAASYYVTDQTRWGVSSVGNYFQATDGNNIISSSQHFEDVVDSKLFETARMSPSSLRYYGLGLENGNYTVVLQFAEFAFPDSQTWLSLGRRVFDIYIQGALKEKDFDIRKTAGGKSFGVVNRSYVAVVSKNFLEIHLFWAGKGTSCIPTQGYYGPMISALSVTPNFTPTVRNGVPKRGSKAGAIAGILIGVIVLALATIFGLFMLVKKRKTIAQQKEENFSSQNILGEGGFGPVYKGKLPDGRVIAVKQLSQSSHQGPSQFVTEVATISAVQHRNLVRLHGCCIDSKTPLLVYEYLENGSLDRAIFGHSSLNLDWAMRFEIILGIARGLTYLHEESSVRIVHRDIKASNILLDIDLTPKISDFGLAKLYDENQTHVSTGIAGTIGYLAPEYAMRGRLTEKADVFAFGVVMLETIAGRPNTDNSLEESKIYLFEWVWGLYEKDRALEIVAPSLKDFDKDEVFRVICVALLCTQGSPHQRPPMSKVVAMLTGDVDVVKVVTKPSYITEWQLRGGGNGSYTGSTNPEFDREKEVTRDSAQAQQAPKTDPVEAAALNTILGRWGKKASPEWNISGELCSGFAADKTDWDYYPDINPFIKCDCTDSNNTVCHITRLNFNWNYLTGPIPSFIGKFTSMEYLALSFNPLSGLLPKELGNLTNLLSLGISSDNFTGGLPEELGNLTKLKQLYFDSSGLSGPFPSSFSKLQNLNIWRASDNGFKGKLPDYLGTMTNLAEIRIGDIVNGISPLAFISNMTSLSTLILRNSKISSDLGAVDFSMFEKFLGNNSLTGRLPDGIWWQTTSYSIAPVTDYSFAVDCGSNASTRGSDDTIYEADPTNLGAATYYVTGQTRWGVSNVGDYVWANDRNNIIYSSQHFQNVVDSELFETARMSASSLRYYGLGLENGNYTVLLQFAEFAYPDSQTWLSLGRRVFDIYIQGALKQKDFDIRKTAGGKSFSVVNKSFTVTVSKNFLEIHLFWAGKGTDDIPTRGYHGPMISALSVTPNFTPTVRNGIPKRESKAGAIAGILIGAIVLVLAALFGVLTLVKKRRALAQQKEELYNLVGRPDVFSYAELKLATNNFSSQNILGEGGFGPVYKLVINLCDLAFKCCILATFVYAQNTHGKLPDERVIAVKQLSQSSHQGRSQFVTEVATISAVQHRNLVILHGCCIDSKTPLLVYEYLENGSLDRAIFGHSSLKLDWATRFEIILGIARGLTYLHEESTVRIVHRDIKASNVLLDSDLTPKISDFGLAKLFDENGTHVSTRIAGTLGYLAPEYAMRGHLSEKADIFAFGVVMLETVAGRPNTNNSLEESKICLLEWAWGLYETDQALGIVDPNLKEFDKDEAFRVICVALVCTQGSPHQRPPMSKVVAMLTGDVDVAKVVAKPSYITEWQLRGGGNSSYTGSTNPEWQLRGGGNSSNTTSSYA